MLARELLKPWRDLRFGRTVVDDDQLPVAGALIENGLQALVQKLDWWVLDRHQDRDGEREVSRACFDGCSLGKPRLVLFADIALDHLTLDVALYSAGATLRLIERVALGDHDST